MNGSGVGILGCFESEYFIEDLQLFYFCHVLKKNLNLFLLLLLLLPQLNPPTNELTNRGVLSKEHHSPQYRGQHCDYRGHHHTRHAQTGPRQASNLERVEQCHCELFVDLRQVRAGKKRVVRGVVRIMGLMVMG